MLDIRLCGLLEKLELSCEKRSCFYDRNRVRRGATHGSTRNFFFGMVLFFARSCSVVSARDMAHFAFQSSGFLCLHLSVLVHSNQSKSRGDPSRSKYDQRRSTSQGLVWLISSYESKMQPSQDRLQAGSTRHSGVALRCCRKRTCSGCSLICRSQLEMVATKSH